MFRDEQDLAIGKMDCTDLSGSPGCEKYMQKGYVMPVISFFSKFKDKSIFYMEAKTSKQMSSFLYDNMIIEKNVQGPKGGNYLEVNGIIELNPQDFKDAL